MSKSLLLLFCLCVCVIACPSEGTSKPDEVASRKQPVSAMRPDIEFCGPAGLSLGTGWNNIGECEGRLKVDWESDTSPAESKALWNFVEPKDGNPIWTEATAYSGARPRRCKSDAKCGADTKKDKHTLVKIRPAFQVKKVHPDAIRKDFGYGGVVVGSILHYSGLDDAAYNVQPASYYPGETTLGYIFVIMPRENPLVPTEWRLERFYTLANGDYGHVKAKNGTLGYCAHIAHDDYSASFTDPDDCFLKSYVHATLKAAGLPASQAKVDSVERELFLQIDLARSKGTKGVGPLFEILKKFEVDFVAWEPCPWGCCPYHPAQ